MPTACGTRRTGSPAAAIAALTSAIEWIRRWKIEAARTASAPPSTTAATKSSGPAAPPEAMTGTPTRELIARSSAVSKPEPVPSRSIEVTSSSPAPRSTTRSAQAMASRPVGFAAALDDDLPRGSGGPARRARIDGDHDRLPSEAAGAAADQRRVGDGRGVERDLVGAGSEDVAHLVDAPDAAAHGQRDERPTRGPLDDVEERATALGRGRDVEEDELIGAFGRVALGELGGIALIDEVDEAGALHDAAVGDVEARDHPAAEHQAARDEVDEVGEQAQAVAAAALGVELDAEQRAAGDRGDERRAVLGRGEDHDASASPGSPAYEWTK